MVHLICKLHTLEHLAHALLPFLFRHSGVNQRQLYIFKGSLPLQQIKGLKNKTDLLAPDLRKSRFALHRNVPSGKPVITGRRRIQTADDIHQCRLSGAGGPQHRKELPLCYREINSLQDMRYLIAHHIILGDPLHLQDLILLRQALLFRSSCRFFLFSGKNHFSR